MQPERRKTAVAFHAKDDLPEIRRSMFQLLMTQDLRFSAVIRDKHRVAAEVRARNAADPEYRYRENELYDSLVNHLFKGGFHEADHFRICFARRGKSGRTAALRQALENSRLAYERNFGFRTRHTTDVIPASPPESAGLPSRRLLPVGIAAIV
jgi:hypothetical protein